MSLDTERILNGTPFKALLNKYNEIKDNLTRTGALEYYTIYSEQPLSFILKNSFYIFTEPFKGTKFYQDVFEKHDIPFRLIEQEINKVREYYDLKKSRMSNSQKELFDQLLSVMTRKAEENRESISVGQLPLTENDSPHDMQESLLCMYDSKQEIDRGLNVERNIKGLRETIDGGFEWELAADMFNIVMDIPDLELDLLEFLRKICPQEPSTEGDWVQSRNASNMFSRMLKDPAIQRKLTKIKSGPLRDKIREISLTPIEVALECVTTVEGNSSEDVVYSTPENSINRIYADAFMDEMLGIDDSKREETLRTEKAIVDTELGYIFNDMISSEDEVHVLESEQRFNELLERSSELDYILVTEFTKDGTQPKVVSKDLETHSEIKKPQKQGLNKRVQTSALDANVQMRKKVAGGQRATQELRNTAKAVTAVPENINNNVKQRVKEWDDLDDDKRKEYILQAGFRKKYFKMFKLALAHYIAFAINPLLNIVLFICSKISSHKDARIRNEVISELATEIRICDEKIQDASNRGEKKKKYQLMRIKDKLEAERVRVTANSKYI